MSGTIPKVAMKLRWTLFLGVIGTIVAVCPAEIAKTLGLKVILTPSESEIFSGEQIAATVQVTNTGSGDLIIPSPDCTDFSALLAIDPPQIEFSGGVGIVCNTTVTVKPGESVSSKVYLSGTVPKGSPVKFRIGFKPSAELEPVWSNQATVGFKKDTELPIKIETSIGDGRIDVSNVQAPRNATVHLQVINTSVAPQNIGISGECCLHELQSLVSDNPAIQIESGVTACMKTMCGPQDTILKPGNHWEQDCRIQYSGDEPTPPPVTFRIGIKSVGHIAAWGNPVTVKISGGTAAWTHHIVYLKSLTKDQQTTAHPDGTRKIYYEDGTLMGEETYKGDKLNGPYKRFDQKGHLNDELNYVDGKMEGEERQYYPDGKLQTVTQHHHNDIVSYITYNEDGTVFSHMQYMRLVNGRWIHHECVESDDHNTNVSPGFFPKCN